MRKPPEATKQRIGAWEALGGLTKVRNGRSCSGAGPTSRSGGSGGVEVADWSQGWFSGLWTFTVRLAVVLRRPNGGQGGPAVAGDMEIAAAEPLTGDASLAKFPVRRDSVRGQGGRGAPLGGGEAKAGVPVDGGSTGQRRRGGGGSSVPGSVAARVAAAFGVGCGCREVRPGAFKGGRAGDCGGAPRD
ncbi:uncharacterized protein LOC120709791 [Panicum virgatum]|uniref:uncharacterized protein LOC120709791 n=1 Tax=Panicum virgatum TaxID=38727 RepID=UPI0019D57757|nr:uncharacterized protein LOC120709791 [Panicum virgatum]